MFKALVNQAPEEKQAPKQLVCKYGEVQSPCPGTRPACLAVSQLIQIDGKNVPERQLDQNDREVLRTSTFDSFEFDDEADPGYQADVYQFFLEPLNS